MTRGTPSADDDLVVATALARLTRIARETADLPAVLAALTAVVGGVIPRAGAVTLTLGSPDSGTTHRLDGLVDRLGEGPRLTARATGQVVTTPDLLTDRRWPRLAAAAGPLGVRSVLGLPVLVADGRCLGVLNVYASGPAAFPDRDVRVGELVAPTIAAVLEQRAEQESAQALVENLRHALTARAVIEQAKGILMAQHGGTPDEAFTRLVELSNVHNVKLREVAATLVRDQDQHGQHGLTGWTPGA